MKMRCRKIYFVNLPFAHPLDKSKSRFPLFDDPGTPRRVAPVQMSKFPTAWRQTPRHHPCTCIFPVTKELQTHPRILDKYFIFITQLASSCLSILFSSFRFIRCGKFILQYNHIKKCSIFLLHNEIPFVNAFITLTLDSSKLAEKKIKSRTRSET